MASENHGAQTQSSGTSNACCGESVSKAIAKYTMDAQMQAVFEQSGESGRSFNYSKSVRRTSPPEQQITEYLSKIQRGGHVQPFGCTLAVNEPALRLIAFSPCPPSTLPQSSGSTPTSVPSSGLFRREAG
ncbi:hypothetical protein J5N97_020198 [Dioscorea zingiberensis]|uniref:PAS fold-2 domain-containing protein n=1 Tax=Dioscorea zingiberensis TaxID=325984 RepID=A0A9D5CG49_9LILI|nr:hypothetical protein J5N97_020198 [Dioscorea zingiberensis]